MRHQRTGKKLGRDSAHRRALYANLASELIEHERIKTTITKAKAVKPIAEQMITLGRRGDMHARRQAVAFLGSKDIVHKLFDDLGPRYAERPGGYLRIIRIGPRPGDAAEMVYLELVDTPLVFKTKPRGRRGARSGPAERRALPAAGAGEATAEAASRRPRSRSRSRGDATRPRLPRPEPDESRRTEAEAAEAEPDAEAEPAAGPETAEPEAEAEAPTDES